MAAYIGSFASGFMQSFLAARSMRMQQEYQKQMSAYYTMLMRNNNYDPQSGKYWDPATSKFSSPVFVAPESADAKAFREGTTNYDKGQVNQKGFNQAGADMVYKALTSRGVPNEAAAGFVGSMAEESSGFNPNARNPNDAGPGKDSIGWGQWNKGRLDGPDGLYTISGKSNWRDLTDADNLKMFEHELDNTKVGQRTVEQLKGAKSVEQGATIGANTYEGSKLGPTQHMDVRIGNGQQYLQKVGTEPKPTTTGGPTAKTATGQPVKTDAEGRAIDPTTGKLTQNAPQITPTSTPKSKSPDNADQASALPGGSVSKPIQTASLDPTSGLDQLPKQGQQLAGIPPKAGPAIGSPAPAVPPSRPADLGQTPTTGQTPSTPTGPTPTAAPQGGQYQPQSGNARTAQWVPNRSPNPPIGGPLAKPQATPVPVAPPQPPARPTSAPGAIPPPPMKPPEAPAAPSAPQQQAPPDVTRGIADANAQREAMASAQLARDQNQDQDVVASAKGGAIPSRVTRYDQGGATAAASPGGNTDAGTAWGGANGGTGYAPPVYGAGYGQAPGTPTTLGYQIQQQANTLAGGNTAWGEDFNPSLSSDQQSWLTNAWTDQQQMAGMAPALQQLVFNSLGKAPPTTPAAPTAATTAAPSAIPLPATAPATTAVNPAAGDAPAPTPVTGSNIPLGTLASTANSSQNIGSNPNFSGATDYNINSLDQTAATNANPSSAVASQEQTAGILAVRGGPMGYDTGGSVAGMPPGLPQQQTIPPIYYNNATYSPYGAPVGRGVSQASIPAYSASAVPTFAKGGAIAYDDGGDVGDDQTPYQVAGGPGDDQTQAPQQVALSTFPHAIHTGIPMPRATTPKLAIPRGPAMRAPPHMPAQKPQPEHFGNPNENMAPETQAPVGEPPQPLPQDAPPSAPQIEDGYGNPSHGLMDAITDGLHTLGQSLGMSGPNQPNQSQGAIPGDASVTANQRAFARGEGAASPDQMNQVYKIVDPGQSLDNAMRNLAGLEAVHNQHLLDGDYDGAGKVAASMLMYAQKMSAKYGDEAVKRFQQGDIDQALAAMKNSADMIPDGRKIHFEKTDNGNVDVAITNLRNVVEWKQTMAPKDLLAYAVKAQNGSLYWDALETQAAKYDPQYKEMSKQKAADAQTAQENQALEYMASRAQGGRGGPRGTQQGALPAPQQVQPGGATMQSVGTPNVTPGSNVPSAGGGSPIPQSTSPVTGPTGAANPNAPTPDNTGASPTAIPPPGSPQRPQDDGDWRPPNYASLSPQFQRQLLTDHLAQQREAQSNQSLDRREQFSAAQQMERENQTNLMADRREASTQRMQDIRDKAGRARTANAPMPVPELTKAFEVTSPADTLNTTPSLSRAAGVSDPKQATSAVPQYIDKVWGQDGKQALAGAVFRGQTFNPRMQTGDVAEAIAGLATGRYVIDKSEAKDISDEYGPRVRFPFGIVGPGGKFQAMADMVLPQNDVNQLLNLKQTYQKANAPAPTRPNLPYPGNAGIPTNPVRPPVPTMIQQPRPGQAIPGPILQRTPNSQVPPEWKQQFPELNQPDQ